MDIDSPQPAAPKRRRRWFQFRLRTLMCFTLAVSVSLRAYQLLFPPYRLPALEDVTGIEIVEYYDTRNHSGSEGIVVPREDWGGIVSQLSRLQSTEDIQLAGYDGQFDLRISTTNSVTHSIWVRYSPNSGKAIAFACDSNHGLTAYRGIEVISLCDTAAKVIDENQAATSAEFPQSSELTTDRVIAPLFDPATTSKRNELGLKRKL
jgi:hypothetical protein